MITLFQISRRIATVIFLNQPVFNEVKCRVFGVYFLAHPVDGKSYCYSCMSINLLREMKHGVTDRSKTKDVAYVLLSCIFM